MKKLLNEFTWSFSRHGTFKECQKKYWYNYYGSWEGWPKTPFDTRKAIDPLASYLYMLKQMQSIPTFIGSAVHETIEHFLKQELGKSQKKLFTADELIGHAHQRFDQGIDDAKSGRYKIAPKKHKNLIEYYFNEHPTDAQLLKAKEKISKCLQNWVSSPIVSMAFRDNASWQSIEELSSFTLKNTYKVIVVVDFCVKWRAKEDLILLFDWKTGAQSEKTEDQLYLYALFAKHVHKAPYEKQVLVPFYLYENTYTKLGAGQEKTIDPTNIQRIEDMAYQSCKRWPPR